MTIFPFQCFFYGISCTGNVSSLSLRWRHNEHDSVSNDQRLDGLLNRLFRRWSKKTPKLRVTGLCDGNSPVTDEFPSQKASNGENVSIWLRNHGLNGPQSLAAMKRKCLHFVEILNIGCTGKCHCDNFLCRQWWTFPPNIDTIVSVNMDPIPTQLWRIYYTFRPLK